MASELWKEHCHTLMKIFFLTWLYAKKWGILIALCGDFDLLNDRRLPLQPEKIVGIIF